MAKYNVHAGHNPAGKVACGAVGLLNESVENRKIAKEVIRLLKLNGHTVYDCTVDNGTSQSDVLNKIVAKCNKHTVAQDHSIHLNSGASDKKGNGETTGVEVLVYSLADKDTVAVAKRICNNIASLGFKNRGVKARPDLCVLRDTKSKAYLTEVCFVDDKDDYNIYQKVGYKAIAEEMVKGMLNKETILTESAPSYTVGKTYVLQSEMNVRKGPGTGYEKKTHEELTTAGQKCDKDKDGALAKGTKVTCKEVRKKANGNIWIRIPSGWVAAYINGKVYVK